MLAEHLWLQWSEAKIFKGLLLPLTPERFYQKVRWKTVLSLYCQHSHSVYSGWSWCILPLLENANWCPCLYPTAIAIIWAERLVCTRSVNTEFWENTTVTNTCYSLMNFILHDAWCHSITHLTITASARNRNPMFMKSLPCARAFYVQHTYKRKSSNSSTKNQSWPCRSLL